jgi:hypothetical protein
LEELYVQKRVYKGWGTKRIIRKRGRWVAKLIARLLATATQGVRIYIDIYKKY